LTNKNTYSEKLNIVSDFIKKEISLHPFEENQSLPENSVENEVDTYLEPLHGAGIFFNRDIKKSSHWSVPWSDLMMTMFVLFAILYVYNITDKEVQASSVEPGIKYREVIQPVRKEVISRRYDVITETLKIEDLKDISSVELTKEKAVKIILPSDVLFDTGEAELKSDAVGSLMAVGQLIQGTDYAVTVAGHTDNIPIHTDRFPSNWELSTTRACVAAKFLIDETNIPPSQIQVIGHAENRPIETNETSEGRNANRRVEVIISKEHVSHNLKPL
jgi:chemotaxis protein MotB